MSYRKQPYSKADKGGKSIKIAIGGTVMIVVIVAVMFFDFQQILRGVLAWIAGLGALGPVIFVGLYILACVLFLPGFILTLGAGAIFGIVTGSVVVSIGSTLGATCTFLIGRYLARDWVTGRISGNEKFKAIDDAVGREGWKIVLLTRLSPVFPFNLLNYGFGLTNVRLKHYCFASWLGMIPGTVTYVYIGSFAGDLAKLGISGHTRTTGEWILYGIGLAATFTVTIIVTRLARKALASHTPSPDIHQGI